MRLTSTPNNLLHKECTETFPIPSSSVLKYVSSLRDSTYTIMQTGVYMVVSLRGPIPFSVSKNDHSSNHIGQMSF